MSPKREKETVMRGKSSFGITVEKPEDGELERKGEGNEREKGGENKVRG